MKIRLFILFLILFSATTFAQVDSCQCEPLSPQVASGTADLIFAGKLIHRQTNPLFGGMKYTFEVIQSWKKKGPQLITIGSGWEKDCGILFQEGERYLVYGKRKRTSLKTNRCMGSKLLSEANVNLEVLGGGLGVSAKLPDTGNTAWVLGVIVLVSFLFFGFVLLKGKILKS